jgi:CHAT domain-containing protein/Tfp pilus assembly protein PilF
LKTEGERRGLLARRKEAATKELARLLNEEGMALADRSDYDGALSLYRLALSVTEGLDFKMGTAFVLNNVGDALRHKGDYDAAAGALARSRSLAEEIGNREAAARATANLALVQMLRGENSAALDSCERSIAVFESLGNKRQVAVILHNMGSLYADQGDSDQALDFFRRALPLREAAGDRSGLAKTLNNFGEVNARKGRYTEALDYLNRSLAIKRELGDRSSVSSTLNGLANVARDRGDRAAALRGYEEVIEMRQSLGLKGMLAETLDDFAEALLRWGEPARALDASERAAALSRETGSPNTLWVARSHAGLALRALGRRGEARAAFEEAVSIVERLRSQVAGAEAQRQRFFEDKVAPYHALVELSLEEGRTAEALAYAERAKARALLDVLTGGRVGVTKAMTAAELARERELSGALSALNSQLAAAGAAANPSAERVGELSARLESARFEYESFEASLYAAHPELRVRRGESPPFEPAQARALMADARGAVLEYVSTGTNAYLFVLTGARGASGGPALKAYKLGAGGAELSARAEEFRRMLAARDMDFRRPARELYELLLAPAAEQLRGAGALVVVPDGGLWSLPFQALVDAEGRYLVESHAVSYAPSLTVLREMAAEARRRGRGAATLLAFGDPSGGVGAGTSNGAASPGATYAPLPDAVRQVKTLAQLYGAERSRVYVGTDASEARVREEAGRFRVLQFTTHAELNDERPLYSHVVLSRGGAAAAGGDDGLLEAWEMMNLDLRADMVVLSACDTARGRYSAGEGVIGMTWALFIAGSPTSVVSQWKVDSASTTELMLDFHRNLLGARVSKAEALRRTALRLLRSPRPQDRDYRHPFYWAGFVIVGDAR